MAAATQESLASFFNESLLQDGSDQSDDDIDKIKWVTAFNKLSIDMTKKDAIKIFDYIDEEQVGYIDRFDFMEFCNTKHFENNAMKHLKSILISRIDAFLRFQQIINDESIQIIYSKHRVNPCKPINREAHTFDPYYTKYYEDDIFHTFDHVKDCLCCSHCSKQFHSYIFWKKHESKCKYDAEKYIAYLIQSVEEDMDISFLDFDTDHQQHQQHQTQVMMTHNGYIDIPPPPPSDHEQHSQDIDIPPPPPPLNPFIIRYNENEMAEILSQIPAKVPIWSRLFTCPNHPFVSNRLQCIENGNGNESETYMKYSKSSAYKDYRDILQKTMFDLLLSATKTPRKQLSFSITKPTSVFQKQKGETNVSVIPIIHEQDAADANVMICTLQYLKPMLVQSSKIRYTHNLMPDQLNALKLGVTDDYIPPYIGDVEESDVDDYDIRVSDTVDETDYRVDHVSISKPLSDNEMKNEFRIDTQKQLEYLRSKSSFNLITTEPQRLTKQVSINDQNIIIKYQNNLRIEDQHTVGQQTLGTNDSDDDSSSSLSDLMKKNTEEEEEVSSLSSATDEAEHAHNIYKTDHKSLKIIDFDIDPLMNMNPLLNHLDSPTTAPVLSMRDSVDAYFDVTDGLCRMYYESVIDLILEFSGLSSAVYFDGFLMLHEMVFDIYNHKYDCIWSKYRLPIWLKLLFDENRLNELEKHYESTATSNNAENGKLQWIYNLHDVIYYDETLFTHLLHCYGIPPSLQSLIWYHLSHNHHISTDLDVFTMIKWTESDIPMMDGVFDDIFEANYMDPIQCILMKSYVFQPYLHHRSHSLETQRIMIAKNKKKLLPNLYYAQYRYIFYYDILYVLLRNIWSELPIECQRIIYTFWSKIQVEEHGNEWIFGDDNIIHRILTNNRSDCAFIMSVYLWDGMLGIPILLTSILLCAIHSKQSIHYFYNSPLLQTETPKLCKIYRFLYDYIVYKSDYDHESVALSVIHKLCHICL